MKIITAIRTFFRKPQKSHTTLEDYRQEALVRQGRIQFERLLQKGLSIPVALL